MVIWSLVSRAYLLFQTSKRFFVELDFLDFLVEVVLFFFVVVAPVVEDDDDRVAFFVGDDDLEVDGLLLFFDFAVVELENEVWVEWLATSVEFGCWL